MYCVYKGPCRGVESRGCGREKAIFSDTNIVITRCAVIGITYLWKEQVQWSFPCVLHILLSYCKLTTRSPVLIQGDRCNLDLVLGCADPSSPFFNQLANVDDGSCPPYSDSED